MNLDLPSPVPLPPDVRRRALATLLDDLDAPAPRRAPWFPALVAAAVVVALVVTTSVALSGRGPDEPPLTAAAPAPGVDIRSDEGMIARCAAAVTGREGYPPATGWRVSVALGGSGDPVIIVDDAFACRLTPVGVYVSGTRGTPMGDVGVVELGPGVLVLLNPQRRVIGMDDDSWNVSLTPDAAVQVLVAPGAERPDTRFTVGDGYAGPLPEPAPAAVAVQDRTLPTRATYGSPEATDEGNDVESCVDSAPPAPAGPPDLWTPVGRIDGGQVPLLLARIGDQQVGVCVLTPDGPRFVIAPMPLLEGAARDPGALVPPPAVVLAVGAGGVYGFDQAAEFPATAPCTDVDGIAVCGDPSTGRLTIRLLVPSEDLTVPRAPGR